MFVAALNVASLSYFPSSCSMCLWAGPLRIKHHDALCEVVWHTLQMDSKGDVFHLDFSLGKPGCFDNSVRSSLQSQFLSKALEYPGAAGDAEEIYRQKWEV